jgi:hypothetical protein
MPLKAVKPEAVKDRKPKFLISGKSGVGKTFFALDFPTPYYIDVEEGAVREQYVKKLIEAGGVYFGPEQGSRDYKSVIDEIKSLATEKHDYKTLIIDSFSHLYNLAAAIAEEKVGNDFGKDKKEANRPTRQLMRWIENLDMTVILICHQRDKWERKNGQLVATGTTFDGFDKLEYILDLWIEIEKTGGERTFNIKKSRIDGFPEGNTFPLSYSRFSTLYGKEIIERGSKPVDMADPEDVVEVVRLLEIVKVEPEIIEKWFTKANVDEFSEMTKEQITACLGFLKKKMAGLTVVNGKAGK